ncbi:MAG: bifunctional hydroxymethylpyrimidine kinase/phosphomethylpyrimidine kinase [Myxacorys californica WJT36-NPBG1]|jgi:rfaE bifunctional protein kinase chain/domain|nr:bifunctional hydroxymethylpyrimidine kinase/phosphomethylpyrimidine kinase [Myxacorys californica WJT36-NPBG1]
MPFDPTFTDRLRQSRDRLFTYLDHFAQATILVVGDLTLDEFLTGRVERVSREAPVLILRHEETQQVPGGGANSIYNFAKLGATVKAVGLLGKDLQGQALQQLLETVGVNTDGIFLDPDRPTVTKTRISGHARQSVTQQIVRVDRKSDALPSPELQQQLAQYIFEQIHTVDAIVCSDYGDGTLTKPVIEATLKHSRTIIDSQKQMPQYQKAFIFTPNLPEAELAVGYSITDTQTLSQAGRDLLRLTGAEHILITRGEQGMTLFDQKGTQQHIPAFNRTKVFDVTGAGDTVVAALTLGLSAGATVWEAAVLGNLAASIVVRQFGTTTTDAISIKTALETLLAELSELL